MSQPTPYSRLYNFTDYQTVNPTKPLPATNLDAELNAVELTLDETLTNLAQIQRDDGKLVNQVVTPESLSAATLAIISQGEYNPRGNWAASTAYAVGDLVTYNAATYLCITANTSTPSFATDNAAGYWLLIANGALQGGGQAVDTFSGNAAQTTFTLSYAYASSNAATVFVAGVAQIPTQDFTIVGTTLTFVSAPPSPSVAGRKNIMVRGTGVEAQLAADLANTASADAQGYAAAALTSKNAAAASQTAAAASQTAAATSATAAAASQSAASTSQTAAATSATAAASSASAASTSQTAAATSATNAAASATSASTSATTATTKATEASTSATNAATSATSAAASATTATTKAADATTAANNAATSATAAGSSSTSAASSATSATNSATTATNAATTATQQASNASSSATSANTSATNAATSATSAATSATAAASSASSASTSATTATTQASNASTSATAAAASAAAAAASYDSFDDRYLGPKASAPTLDNDGNALLIGALYFNTTTNAMQVYGSSGWTAAGSSVNGTSRRFEYVATAGQTTFTGADAAGNTLAYDAGYVDVYLNGARLKSNDFTASSGTSIVLAVAAALNDELNIVAFGTFTLADHYNKTDADARFVNATGDVMTSSLQISNAAFDAALRLTNTGAGGQDWYLFSTMNSFTQGGGKLMAYNGGNGHPYDWAIDSAGRVTMPYQPYASWTVSCVLPSNTRTYALRSNIGNCTSIIGPAQGSNPGSIVRFTAPVAGRYLVTVTASQAGTNSPTGSTSSCLISAFGSWSGSSNSVQPSQEIIDTRGARGLDDVGNSFILNLAQGDHIEPDFYTSYESGGKIDVTVQLIS